MGEKVRRGGGGKKAKMRRKKLKWGEAEMGGGGAMLKLGGELEWRENQKFWATFPM